VRAGLQRFLEAAKSYWPGLFGGDETPDLPRTNNDLEQAFGRRRYDQRQASGRRRAAPGSVERGSARVISGSATRRGRRKVRCGGQAMRRTGESGQGGRSGGARRGESGSATIRPPRSRSWRNRTSRWFCKLKVFYENLAIAHSGF
jgi:hypothetical protein